VNAVPVTSNTARRKEIGTVNLADLMIDPEVQREEGADVRRVAAIARNFDPDALGVIIVSVRADGTKVVLDGMHRCGGAREARYKEPLDAILHYGLTREDEAALFLAYNNKKDPSAVSKFRARVVMGDPVAVEIAAILNRHGWEITSSNFSGAAHAATAIERAYTKGSGTLKIGTYPEVLDKTFGCLTAAWGHDETAAQQHIVEGLAQLFGRFGAGVDIDKLVREMEGTTPRRLAGQAKALRDAQGGTVPAALAKYLTSMHNRRKRVDLLPEWIWTR